MRLAPVAVVLLVLAGLTACGSAEQDGAPPPDSGIAACHQIDNDRANKLSPEDSSTHQQRIIGQLKGSHNAHLNVAGGAMANGDYVGAEVFLQEGCTALLVPLRSPGGAR